MMGGGGRGFRGYGPQNWGPQGNPGGRGGRDGFRGVPARKVVRRRCVAVAARIAGLVRKVILSRVPATTVGRDSVEAATDGAALRP